MRVHHASSTVARGADSRSVQPASCGKNVTANIREGAVTDPQGRVRQPAGDRFAWLHIPKAGTTFGNTLLQIVANASGCGNVGPDSQEWQDPVWAKHTPLGRWLGKYYWRKRLSFDGHDEISEAAWQAHQGHFVGFFRGPAWRAHSAYHHFELPLRYPACKQLVSEREYAERVRGTMTLMLAGQSSGLDCHMSPHRLRDHAHKGHCDQRIEPNTPLALRRLQQGFSFVGLTDAWALSICLCAPDFLLTPYPLLLSICLCAPYFLLTPYSLLLTPDSLLPTYSLHLTPLTLPPHRPRSFHLTFGGACTAIEFSNSRPGHYTRGSGVTPVGDGSGREAFAGYVDE